MPRVQRRTHPGQAHASARKRRHKEERRRLEKTQAMQRLLRARNRAQDRQDRVSCEIMIRDLAKLTGSPHWISTFKPTVEVVAGAEKYFGSRIVKTEDYLRVNSDLNGVSMERTVLGQILSLGYQLEELQVEISGDPKKEAWGRCVWYKDHPNYHTNKHADLFPNATPTDMSILFAMFKTEHAGDQQISLPSMQMVGAALIGQRGQGFLFHKALVFRRAIFSLPEPALARAA